MRLEKYFTYIIFAILTCSFSAQRAMADETTLDLAISEYIKGFRACNEANNLRTSDLAQAKANFHYYSQQLSKAISIDDAVLHTTSREMATNIKYCKRVESNLQRAEATPILEQGIEYCKSAKSALSSGNLTLANEELNQYRQLKEESLDIASDLMEVFALASKIRTCTRVEEKLAKAESAASQAEDEMKKAIAAYQTFNTQCDIAKQYVSSPTFDINQLLKANKLLNNARKSKKGARKNEKAFELADESPNSESAATLTSLIKSSRNCENVVSTAIRRATKVKRSYEKDLSKASKSLAAALKECKSAQHELRKPLTIAALDGLRGIYHATSDVRDTISSNESLLKISQLHKGWPQSKSLKQNLKNTSSCLSIFTATLKATKPIPNQTVSIEPEAIIAKPEKEVVIEEVQKATDELVVSETQSQPTNTQQDSTPPPSPVVEEEDIDEFDEFDQDQEAAPKKSWVDIIN
ncbi:hypothetical protein A9Q99_07875 [Gammaproteobacteria bacterium 45_16_T64]|nr:hypothetical protein A9Q99_07875 [Gammaproteobacteria bacterium 45_16_T64]